MQLKDHHYMNAGLWESTDRLLAGDQPLLLHSNNKGKRGWKYLDDDLWEDSPTNTSQHGWMKITAYWLVGCPNVGQRQQWTLNLLYLLVVNE